MTARQFSIYRGGTAIPNRSAAHDRHRFRQSRYRREDCPHRPAEVAARMLRRVVTSTSCALPRGSSAGPRDQNPSCVALSTRNGASPAAAACNIRRRSPRSQARASMHRRPQRDPSPAQSRRHRQAGYVQYDIAHSPLANLSRCHSPSDCRRPRQRLGRMQRQRTHPLTLAGSEDQCAHDCTAPLLMPAAG